MITLGIDLAAQPKNTAAAIIRWSRTEAVAELHSRCQDATLHGLIRSAAVIGIDAPFGWPCAFREAVQSWPHREWGDDLRDLLTLRETDRQVMKLHGGRPLSVAADRIALPAMRAMSLLSVHGVTDRSGNGRFFEVYPKASLQAWGLSPKGYKSAKAVSAVPRRAILEGLRTRMPWLRADDSFAEDADALDALLAALTTRAAAQGRTILPTDAQVSAARVEGWIHVPTKLPCL